ELSPSDYPGLPGESNPVIQDLELARLVAVVSGQHPLHYDAALALGTVERIVLPKILLAGRALQALGDHPPAALMRPIGGVSGQRRDRETAQYVLARGGQQRVQKRFPFRLAEMQHRKWRAVDLDGHALGASVEPHLAAERASDQNADDGNGDEAAEGE